VIFTETAVRGAYLIDLEPIEDVRGFNARMWCHDEFSARGLVTRVAQCNIIFNKQKGTLRGLHYQAPPHEEAKVVRCTRGGVFAVVADLRPLSSTRLGWAGAELTADNYQLLYVPPGCALGSQSLQDDSEILYQVSEFYQPTAGRGVRYDDPILAIRWPLEVSVVSEKDRSWPPYVAPPR
jgi:dTDP-4-dehydrorhamnose 3,5-epimerase